MLERGSFDGLNAAMMVHPWPTELNPNALSRGRSLRRHGRRCRGARVRISRARSKRRRRVDARPSCDRAAQAALLPSDQVHGIITYGGAAPNIVPSRRRRSTTSAQRTLETPRRVGATINVLRPGRLGRYVTVVISTSSLPPIRSFASTRRWAAHYLRNAMGLGRVSRRRATAWWPPRPTWQRLARGCRQSTPHLDIGALAGRQPSSRIHRRVRDRDLPTRRSSMAPRRWHKRSSDLQPSTTASGLSLRPTHTPDLRSRPGRIARLHEGRYSAARHVRHAELVVLREHDSAPSPQAGQLGSRRT